MTKTRGTPFLGQDIGNCPGCGKSVAISLDPPGVIHGLPQCDDFRKRDPIEFAKWVNDVRGRPS